MPRVRVHTAIANRNFSLPDGAEADVPAELAQMWVSAGIAEYVAAEAVLTPERRVQAPEVRRRPGRPRKNPI
jgi:hypothetical protein